MKGHPSDNDTNPIDVELTEINVEKKSLQNDIIEIEDVNINFCTHVGWDGVLGILFSLFVAAIFVYITSLYTESYQVWENPLRWVLFLSLALLHVLLVLKVLIGWKSTATKFTSQQQKQQKEKAIDTKKDDANIVENAHQRSISAIDQAKNRVGKIKQIYNNLKLNGKWFLWKLYLSELFESFQQCINLVTVYLCSIPVEISIFISFCLTIECLQTMFTMIRPNTPSRRDRQLKIDLFFDFVCAFFAPSILGLVYKIPISLTDMISITVMPTLFLLAKLDDILEQGIHQRSASYVLKQQVVISKEKNRRLESMFQQIALLKTIKEQEDAMPIKIKYIAGICKGIFGLFFFVIGIVHLSIQPSRCDDVIWTDNCVNKIPFCNNLFEPTCNCATLVIKNNHSLTTLPNSLVEMNGLRRVLIWNCNLTSLPPEMEKLSEMVDFDISFNQLEQFDVDVSKWPKLARLFLMYNKITTYNVNALWTHQNIDSLDLRDNIGLQMPDQKVQINMPRLTYLHLGNNSMNATIGFDTTQFPILRFLYLNGNRLIVFPDQSLKDSLIDLGIARCNLKSIPSYLSEFQKLKYIDARDNNIYSIDSKLKDLISNNQIESYFSGNSICAVDSSLDCKPLCSKYCWSRNVLSDGICDVTCNSKVCEYDGGDCMATE